MNKKLYLYVKAFSDMGTMMEMVVMNAFILMITKSPDWLAANLALRVLGGVLSSMLAGVWADRYSRKRLMIFSDILRACSIAILIVFPIPPVFLIVSFLTGFLASFFQVSFSAEVPQIYGEKDVLKINALISRLSSICMVLGFLGAGIISDYLGFRAVMLIDLFSFLLSASILYFLHWDVSAPQKNIRLRFVDELKEVKNYVLFRPLLVCIILILLVSTFGASSHNVGIPLLAHMLNEKQSTLIQGLIWGVWGIGTVFITIILPKVRDIEKSIYQVFFSSIICMSSGFILFLSQQSMWLILPIAFLTGIFDAAVGTLYSSIIQKTDNNIRGRMFGITHLLNRFGFFLGFITVPLLLKVLSLASMVQIMHGTVIFSCTIMLLVIYRKKWMTVKITASEKV